MSINADLQWTPFYNMIADKGPSSGLLKALSHIEPQLGAKRKYAVDLGCGEGRDTVELLRRQWTVLAVDACEEGLRRLNARLSTAACGDRIKTQQASYLDATWTDATLVNASLALPYCPPAEFSAVWQKLVNSIAGGGWFVGELFGDRHSWATSTAICSCTLAEATKLLEPFDIVHLNEIERSAMSAAGDNVTAHYFEILARKKSPVPS